MINKKNFFITFGLFVLIVIIFFIINSKLYVKKYLFEPLKVEQFINSIDSKTFEGTYDKISLINNGQVLKNGDLKGVSELLHSSVVRFLQNNKSYIYSYSEKNKLSKKEFKKLKNIVGNISLEGAYFLNPRYLDVVNINFKYNNENDSKILFDYIKFIIFEELVDLQDLEYQINYHPNLVNLYDIKLEKIRRIDEDLEYLNFYPSTYIDVSLNNMIDQNLKSNLYKILNFFDRLDLSVKNQYRKNLILEFKNVISDEKISSARNLINSFLDRYNKIPKHILISDLEILESNFSEIYSILDSYDTDKLNNGYLRSSLLLFSPEFKNEIIRFLNFKRLKMTMDSRNEMVKKFFFEYQKLYPSNEIFEAKEIFRQILFFEDDSVGKLYDQNAVEAVEKVLKILVDINRNLNLHNNLVLRNTVSDVSTLDPSIFKKDLEFIFLVKKMRHINSRVRDEFIELNPEKNIRIFSFNNIYFNFDKLADIYSEKNIKLVSKKLNYIELLSNILFAFVMSLIITFLFSNMKSQKET